MTAVGFGVGKLKYIAEDTRVRRHDIHRLAVYRPITSVVAYSDFIMTSDRIETGLTFELFKRRVLCTEQPWICAKYGPRTAWPFDFWFKIDIENKKWLHRSIRNKDKTLPFMPVTKLIHPNENIILLWWLTWNCAFSSLGSIIIYDWHVSRLCSLQASTDTERNLSLAFQPGRGFYPKITGEKSVESVKIIFLQR